MKTTVKMKDIAERLGMSRSTVSRALSGSPLVNEETKRRVKKVSKELNFRANLTARSMITQKSNIIGCLVHSLAYNSPLAYILEMVQEKLKSLNYELYIVSGANDLNLQNYLADKMLARCVDGVIMVPPFILQHSEYKPLNIISSAGLPCVVFGFFPNCPVSQVCVDLFSTGYSIGQHLLSLGHKDIATVYYISDDPRIEGLKKRMAEDGIHLPSKYFIRRDLNKYAYFHPKDCSSLCKDIINLGATAVFADSDEVAVRMVYAFNEMGISVPGDISVATAGNSLPLDVIAPGITSYQWPYELMAETLYKIISELISGDNVPVKHIFLSGNLVIRSSTGRQY